MNTGPGDRPRDAPVVSSSTRRNAQPGGVDPDSSLRAHSPACRHRRSRSFPLEVRHSTKSPEARRLAAVRAARSSASTVSSGLGPQSRRSPTGDHLDAALPRPGTLRVGWSPGSRRARRRQAGHVRGRREVEDAFRRRLQAGIDGGSGPRRTERWRDTPTWPLERSDRDRPTICRSLAEGRKPGRNCQTKPAGEWWDDSSRRRMAGIAARRATPTRPWHAAWARRALRAPGEGPSTSS